MRIVTFGCSLTYGHGLKDCCNNIGQPGPVPSQFAWPQILADRLGVQCVNRSKPGASNKFILKRLQDFYFDKNDIVICLWTHRYRYTIFKENATEYIGRWLNNKVTRMYYKHIQDDYDSLIDLYTRANWAKNYLDIKGIKNYHMLNFAKDLTNEFDWNRIDFLPLHMNVHKEGYPLANDNNHPGEEAHRDFAIKLEKLLDI